VYKLEEKMGVEHSIYLNNNIFEKNMETTVEKICKKLNLEYDIHFVYSDLKNKLKLFIENDDMSEKSLFEKKSLDIHIMNQSFRLCKNSICLYDYPESKFDFVCKWSGFMHFLRGQYKDSIDKYIKYKINEIKEFSKLFESTQLIIFAEDEDLTEDELDDGETIENILKKPRWEIIKPDDLPIYYNENEFKKYYNTGSKQDEKKYFGLNYIYYETWKYENDFNENIWEDKYLNLIDG
jgi:hypothetical protein